jgi:hypothetical protein
MKAAASHTLMKLIRDGRHFVSRSDDSLVKVWSVSARKEVASLDTRMLFVRSLLVPMGNILFRKVVATW